MPRDFGDWLFQAAGDPYDTTERPLVLDERVNPPTPPEREGLAATIVGSMWDDPIALMGWQPGALDENDRPLGGARGDYNLPEASRGNPDRVRIDPRLRGEPDYVGVGRHEYRHRGVALAHALAREYGVEVPDYRYLRHEQLRDIGLSERTNVLEDRRTGHNTSYQDIASEFERDPAARRFYGGVADYYRLLADRINAARIERLNAHPETRVSDLP